MDFYKRNVTTNFILDEFFKSATAIRHGIDNYTMELPVLTAIRNTAENVLQPLRNVIGGIRITSGYRCLELNRLLKSGDNSNHRYGYAVDIQPTNNNISLTDVLVHIHSTFEYKELIAEYFPTG
jgi:hypothetical protein